MAEVDDPVPGSGEVLVEVAATAVNRADLMQRQGMYPPPPGASDILGLECAGVVAQLGLGVEDWRVGDRVCALLSGGGYAAKVTVPAGQLLPVPSVLSLAEAAALPEATATVWSNVFMLAVLQPDEQLLVHGGSSGIGTMAIQLARALGAKVSCTVGTAEKAAACRELGADLTINYREQDFTEVLLEHTDGHGADVILDNMGAEYLPGNIAALATAGRLVVIGLQGGGSGQLDLGALLRKRGAVLATALRARPSGEKAAIIASVRENVWPLVDSGAVRPVVHASFPLEDVRRAHRLVESSNHIGKVVLLVNPSLAEETAPPSPDESPNGAA